MRVPLPLLAATLLGISGCFDLGKFQGSKDGPPPSIVDAATDLTVSDALVDANASTIAICSADDPSLTTACQSSDYFCDGFESGFSGWALCAGSPSDMNRATFQCDTGAIAAAGTAITIASSGVCRGQNALRTQTRAAPTDDAYVSRPGALPTTSTIWMRFFFNPNTTSPGTGVTIFSLFPPAPGNAYPRFSATLNSSHSLTYAFVNGGMTTAEPAQYTITAGAWNCIEIMITRQETTDMSAGNAATTTTMTGYVNGLQTGSYVNDTSYYPNWSNLVVGLVNSSATTTLDFLYDEVAVSTTRLGCDL